MRACADDHWNWDTWTGEEGGEQDGGFDVSEPHCEDQDFIVS